MPFSFGYASPVLVAPNYWWYAARGAVRALRDRYPGLDVYDLEETSRRLGTRAPWRLLAHLPRPASARPARRTREPAAAASLPGSVLPLAG
ncbi:type VI immunity family protein [Archangium gephyra]|uniref:type VI immunity family protein n=1 Tax=Archangium gephyra TaxID=48 RepID=UPI0023EA5096|nr:type VI immunity family protein [Archangium gephyra]